MFLFIDTTENEIVLALFQKDKLIDQIQKKAQKKQAELLLIVLDEFLKKNKVNLQNIKGIIVVQGPDSFTGTRIGVTTANALGFSLDIPVVGMKKISFSQDKIIKEEISKFKKIKNFLPVNPIYSAPPPITKKKKK